MVTIPKRGIKYNLTVTIPPALVDEFDSVCGDTSRSSVIEALMTQFVREFKGKYFIAEKPAVLTAMPIEKYAKTVANAKS